VGGTLVLTEEEIAYILRRQRRVRMLQTTVVVLVVAAIIWWLWLRPLPPIKVAVAAPQVVDGLPEGMAETIRMAIAGELAQLRNVYPFGSPDVDAAGGDPRRIGRALSADEVITVTVARSKHPDSCRIMLTRIITRSESASGRGFDVEPATPLVAGQAAARQMLDLYDERRRPWTRARAADYAALVEICRRRDQGAADQAILAELRELISSDSSCPAEAFAVAITVAHRLWQTTRAPTRSWRLPRAVPSPLNSSVVTVIGSLPGLAKPRLLRKAGLCLSPISRTCSPATIAEVSGRAGIAWPKVPSG
jgi:hypothetical protein